LQAVEGRCVGAAKSPQRGDDLDRRGPSTHSMPKRCGSHSDKAGM
jgi:hypothetical protein